MVELIVDALLAFPDDLFVQKLGLRALYVLCGGAKSIVVHGSDSVFETVATIVDHGGTEVCVLFVVFVVCFVLFVCFVVFFLPLVLSLVLVLVLVLFLFLFLSS